MGRTNLDGFQLRPGFGGQSEHIYHRKIVVELSKYEMELVELFGRIGTIYLHCIYSALAEEFILDLYQSTIDNMWENAQKFYLMMENLDLVQK